MIPQPRGALSYGLIWVRSDFTTEKIRWQDGRVLFSLVQNTALRRLLESHPVVLLVRKIRWRSQLDFGLMLRGIATLEMQ
jgi:hypothetical protein